MDAGVADRDVRLFIFRRFLEAATPPSVEDTAHGLDLSVEEARASYQRLAEARMIVLHPGTVDVWMAHPLSAVPTPFLVETGGRSYFGNCAWDGPGVLAMLHADGRVATRCPDCGELLDLVIVNGQLASAEGIIHYAVPARKWWDDIGDA